MKVIYLQGPHSSGKTIRARQLQIAEPYRTVRTSRMADLTITGLVRLRAQQLVSCSDEDLIVVVDPDGAMLPEFEFEIEHFEARVEGDA